MKFLSALDKKVLIVSKYCLRTCDWVMTQKKMGCYSISQFTILLGHESVLDFWKIESDPILRFIYDRSQKGNFQYKSPVETRTSVRLIEVSLLRLSIPWRFFDEKDTYVLPGHVKVSVLERFPSDGMSVLIGFTIFAYQIQPIYIV